MMRVFIVLVVLGTLVAGDAEFKDLSGDYELVRGGPSFCSGRLTVKAKDKRLNEVKFSDGKEPCTIRSRNLERGELDKKNEFRDQLGIGVRTAAPLACGAGMFVTMELYRPSETFDFKVGSMEPIRQKEDVKYLHFVREDASELCVYQQQGNGEQESPTPSPSRSPEGDSGSNSTPNISRPTPSSSSSPSLSASPLRTPTPSRSASPLRTLTPSLSASPLQTPTPSMSMPLSPTASSSPRTSIPASPSSALAESNSTSVLSPDTAQNATSTNAQSGGSVIGWVGPLLAALAAIALVVVGVYCVTFSE